MVSETGHILLVVTFWSWLFGLFLKGGRGAVIGFAVGAILTILPEPYCPQFHSRSILGDLSVASWILLSYWLVRSIYGVHFLNSRDFFRLVWPVAIIGSLIYPGTLGILIYPDFYDYGYASPVLLILLLAVAVLMTLRGSRVIGFWIGGALLMYGLRLNESLNLWDSLIDLLAVIFAILYLVYRAFVFRKRNRKTTRSNTGT